MMNLWRALTTQLSYPWELVCWVALGLVALWAVKLLG
jgi:hypothetical protein